MRHRFWVVLVLITVTLALPIVAQEQKQQPPMSPEEKKAMEAWQKFMTPAEAHKALGHMIGTFEAKVTTWPQPGMPAQTSIGTSENHWVLGNRFVRQDFTGSFMNMPFQGVGYTGYDNGKKQYVGTWMDNFGTGIMVSNGTSADGGKTYTFKTTTTNPMTGTDMPGEMRITVVDADHHNMEMWGPSPADGKMTKMMNIEYSRKK